MERKKSERQDARTATNYAQIRRTIIGRVKHEDIQAPTDGRKGVSRPAGPSSVVFARAALSADGLLKFVTEVGKTYPQICHFRLMREHAYILTDPTFIVEVFANSGRHTMKGRALQGAKAFLGNGLLTSNGDAHLHNRRLIQPAFHRDRVAGYAQQMAALTVAHEMTWKDGMEINMSKEMSELTLLIVGRTLFNSDLSGDAREFGEALVHVTQSMNARLLMSPRVVAIDLHIRTPRRRRLLENLSRLDQTVQNMIDEHRAHLMAKTHYQMSRFAMKR